MNLYCILDFGRMIINFLFFFRECAELLFDLQTVPGRYFFELLSKFTSDEQEQEKFIEFTTSEVNILNTLLQLPAWRYTI